MDVLFEPDSGIIQDVKFADGSFVRRGRVLIEYLTADGMKQKVKCPQNGVVTFGEAITKGSKIEKGSVIATVGACSHAIVMKDLCATCGKELREKEGRAGERVEGAEAHVSMVHHVPELHVSKTLAKELGDRDQERLLANRKLVLLVDLDQTVIHTANRPYDCDPEKNPDMFTYRINSGTYTTKIRPHANEFLKNMNELYEMHIVTMGQRQYAHKIAELLDPDHSLFRERILSRDELFSQHHKTANLKALFPSGQHMIVIIDDRSDVWQFSEALIQVKPYRFFRDVGDINAPLGAKDEDPKNGTETSDDDSTLKHIEKVLQHVHTNFYAHYDRTQNIRDVKVVISYLKQQVLRGLVIVLSGVVPLGTPVEKSDIYLLCKQFGAKVEHAISDETTHLIAARWGTDKVHLAAKKGNIHIVTPAWLSSCIEVWGKAEEKDFILPKDAGNNDKEKKKQGNVKSKTKEGEHKPSSSVKPHEHELIHMTLDDKTFADMENEVDEALSDEEDDGDTVENGEEEENEQEVGNFNGKSSPLKRPRELEENQDDDDDIDAKRARGDDAEDENEAAAEYEDDDGDQDGVEQADYGEDTEQAENGDAEDEFPEADYDNDDDDEDDEMAAMVERQFSEDAEE